MRIVRLINDNWRFCKENVGPEAAVTAGELLNLPHTWNNLDGQDGGNNYYRGTCTYEKTFPMPVFSADERVYLQFNGVNASAKVILSTSSRTGERHRTPYLLCR